MLSMPMRHRKDPDAILVGAQGCHEGGYERAKQLHPKHLSAIGLHGAKTRWSPKYNKSNSK